MASTFGVRMAHHEEAQVSSHLLCSIPHGTFVEIFHAQRDPIWHHLIANKPDLADGSITLSERPGLGWELDWDYVERHRVPL
jgi:L-alanine-DL-glutamate epimerase-like enolase superfamily enzyme